MTKSEGVIQYRLDHRAGPLPADADYAGLFRWFKRCRERDLLGRDPQRYGGHAYGNISARCGEGFLISGTQTGGKMALSEDDLAYVEAFDPAANELRSRGPARPSSEAMTHGEIYRALPAVAAVIHVHTPVIWTQAARLGLPATPPDAEYGTPEMAAAVARLLEARPEAGVISMAGHEDGIIAYGMDLDAAGDRLLATLTRAEHAQRQTSSR